MIKMQRPLWSVHRPVGDAAPSTASVDHPDFTQESGSLVVRARDGMSRPRVHVPQRGQGDRSVTRDVPVAALSDDAFEQTDGLAQFPPDALEIREVQTSDDDAKRGDRALRLT